MPTPDSIKLAFSTNAYTRFPLIDAIRDIAAVGYSGVEILADVPHAYPDSIDAALEKSVRDVLDETGITPDVNQIELNPYSARKDSREYHAAHGIVTESYSPLGASGAELTKDPVITAIANDHGRSPAQVVLRWHIQLGLVAIPRSSNAGRIAENINIFDFELTEQEMSRISALDRGDSAVTDSDVFGH